MDKMENLKGQKFNKLLVNDIIGVDKWGNAKWICLCECGNEVVVAACRLKSGEKYSCGCSRRKRTINTPLVEHGGRKAGKITPEYKSWQHMKDRCYNESCNAYSEYGGRGILICDRWLESFQNFFADMGKRPTPKHSIDRYPNNDGNYEPGNCRWATKKQQAGNRRSSHWIEMNGEKIILADLAIKLGVTPNTIHNRINNMVCPFEGQRGKLVLDTETGIFYNSAKEAAEAKNINPAYLRNQITGNCRNKTSLIYA